MIQYNQIALFSKRKRVDFNILKCFELIINYKDKTPCPALFINEEEIARAQSTLYLGDISDSGTNKDLIEDRVRKRQINNYLHHGHVYQHNTGFA